MPVVSVDQDILNEIMRVRQLIKGSIDGVMDGTLTAGHLASDVQVLLELLDKLSGQPAPAAVEQPAQPAAPQPEQPQPVAQPQPEQPAPQPQPEQPQVEQPQSEQLQPEQVEEEVPVDVEELSKIPQ